MAPSAAPVVRSGQHRPWQRQVDRGVGRCHASSGARMAGLRDPVHQVRCVAVGEKKIACQLGVSWLEGGDGFSWDSSDLNQSADHAVAT
jgi:hypothetical protein